MENLKSASFVDSFGSPLSCHAVRLHPGQEFRKALLDFVAERRLKAPFIMTCVGSAQCAKLRLASATAGDTNYVSIILIKNYYQFTLFLLPVYI